MKQFEIQRVKKSKRSIHDLSYEHKTTGNMGFLYPVHIQEVIPDSKVIIRPQMLTRFMPLVSPAMQRINQHIHWFYVPKRLIWDGFEEHMTGGKDGKQSPNHPRVTGTNAQFREKFVIGSLADYMGLPVRNFPNNANVAQPLSVLPFRAYWKVWNEWYRDQTLENEKYTSTGNTDYPITDYDPGFWLVAKRNFEKDYFTSALPWAQRGDQVVIPLLGDAPVTGLMQTDVNNANAVTTDANGVLTGDAQGMSIEQGLYADLSQASSTPLIDLRKAYALQRFLEAMARGGARFKEYLLHVWGVNSPDSRLQRSEYLGGSTLPIHISEVLQTSQSDELVTPQGNMAGHGIAAGMENGFERYFPEHGYVLGVCSVIPRTSYMNGIPKMFMKFDRFDDFTPQFAHIGEAPIYKKEIYYNGDPTKDDAEFGYNVRYPEHRFSFDRVSGEFRDTLKHWHLSREFDAEVSLNSTFINANVDKRIFAVQDGETDLHNLLFDFYFDIKVISPVPKHGDPI